MIYRYSQVLKGNLTGVLLLLCAFATNAQRQNVYYINKMGHEVPTSSEADYIRIIVEPDSGTLNYKLLEIGLDSTLKRTGFVSEYYPKLVYEGILVKYEKGKKIQADNYEKGKLTGLSRHYYPNGKLKKTLDYTNAPDFKLIDFYDSTGVKLVNNGTGFVKDEETYFYEEGSYLNGKRTGTWKGRYIKEDIIFEEEYDSSGALISGTSIRSGISYPYKILEELPVFPGGQKAWIRFIQQYKYPADARKAKVSGKVYIGFVVEKDGSLKDIHIVKPLFPSADAETMRLFEASPLWTPGKQRGIPVRVAYTQVIALNLN